jgi:DNA-binding response OmpR family regulator
MKRALILVVDDDQDILDSSRIILESHGYEVCTASDGQKAMKELQDNKPDLMILDIMMATETEGFDLAFELKEKPEFKNLPIIILTSFLEKVRADGPEKFEYILGEQWPAHWLFEKPLDTEKLLAKIEDFLGED